MFQDADNHKRQLWVLPTETTNTWSHHCTPFILPSNGVLSFADSVITLSANVIFRPQCTGVGIQDVSSIAGLQEPFYSSTIPQTYVIAAATVIAWILVIMLLITPRTKFLGHSGAAPGFSNGHGLIQGATGGGPSLIGVGSRPWLQKVAALTVAVSLTIATADTFKAAERQYDIGYMDANSLRLEVLGSLEIRITRVVSDVFLWLAQVQTLIRLFPRHKEKVLIKWIGFALILFDSLFSCLNSFMIKTTHPPREFVDAIPALSYLFELALGLLYAAWVIYYSLTKRRYAYWHTKMHSICIIATLSLVAVLTPVVFFVTDVSNPDVAGWGDYFRWVGAAAASVVVWEWVERIEALERDEKKDGILGREIFDGDEMLDVTPTDDVVWTHTRRDRNQYRRNNMDGDSSGRTGNQSSAMGQGLNSLARRLRKRQYRPQEHFPLGRAHSHAGTASVDLGNATNLERQNGIVFGNLPKPRVRNEQPTPGELTPPPAIASPVSRANTTSAASTVYVVQYNPAADIPQPVRRRADPNSNTEQILGQVQVQDQRHSTQEQVQSHVTHPEKEEVDDDSHRNTGRDVQAWYSVPNPFKRKRASPPAEVHQARQMADRHTERAATPAHNFSPWDIKNRIGVLAAETGERFRDRRTARRQQVDLPVTIIPAQPRGSGQAWTPQQQVVAQASTGVESSDSSRVEVTSGSSTPTATGHIAPLSLQGQSGAAREHDISPPCVGGASSPIAISPPSRNPNTQPPRADDVNPLNGSSATVVVSAPRRLDRNSRLATHHVASSSSRDAANGEDHDNG